MSDGSSLTSSFLSPSASRARAPASHGGIKVRSVVTLVGRKTLGLVAHFVPQTLKIGSTSVSALFSAIWIDYEVCLGGLCDFTRSPYCCLWSKKEDWMGAKGSCDYVRYHVSLFNL